MGNRKISPDLKVCPLSLWDRGWQVEDIVNALLMITDLKGESLQLECHLQGERSSEIGYILSGVDEPHRLFYITVVHTLYVV